MDGSFLQSPEWEQINKEMGRNTWRVNGTLIIRHDIKKGVNYLYCPRADVDGAGWNSFLSGVERIAKSQGSLFLKIDPVRPISLNGAHGRIREGAALQPRETIVVNTEKSEEDMLHAMHEKTRYNIGLAERKGIEVRQVVSRDAKDDFETFWKLLSETAARGKFHLHAKRYYELLSRVRTKEMSNEFFFARMPGEYGAVLAAAMVNFYRDPKSGALAATYLHGASSGEHRDMMAPYALHWQAIRETKRRGGTAYDFWGIDETRWPGITRFKRGFGGSTVVYPPAMLVIYRPVWYMFYYMIKKKGKR